MDKKQAEVLDKVSPYVQPSKKCNSPTPLPLPILKTLSLLLPLATNTAMCY